MTSPAGVSWLAAGKAERARNRIVKTAGLQFCIVPPEPHAGAADVKTLEVADGRSGGVVKACGKIIDVEGASAAGLRAVWKRTPYLQQRITVPTIDVIADVLNLDELPGPPASSLARFFNALTAWAATQSSIQGVALVGSHARDAATEKSDVDLVILTDDPQAFLRDRNWVWRFGQVVDQNVEDYGNVVSLRVYYESGLEVEFGLAEPAWSATPLDAGTREVIAGGFKVLLDRGRVLSRIGSALI